MLTEMDSRHGPPRVPKRGTAVAAGEYRGVCPTALPPLGPWPAGTAGLHCQLNRRARAGQRPPAHMALPRPPPGSVPPGQSWEVLISQLCGSPKKLTGPHPGRPGLHLPPGGECRNDGQRGRGLRGRGRQLSWGKPGRRRAAMARVCPHIPWSSAIMTIYVVFSFSGPPQEAVKVCTFLSLGCPGERGWAHSSCRCSTRGPGLCFLPPALCHNPFLSFQCFLCRAPGSAC